MPIVNLSDWKGVTIVFHRKDGGTDEWRSEQLGYVDIRAISENGFFAETEFQIKTGPKVVSTHKESPVQSKKHKESTVWSKRAKDLEPEDHVFGFGKVKNTFRKSFRSEQVALVLFEGKPEPALFPADKNLYLKNDGSVRDVHYPDRSLVVEKSIWDWNIPDDEVYLKVVKNGETVEESGVYVNRNELKKALSNPRKPE